MKVPPGRPTVVHHFNGGFALVALIGLLSLIGLTPASGQVSPTTPSRVQSLDGFDWRLAIDPMNLGRQEKWWGTPRPEAKRTRVPWIIQEPFPGYHGVAWYWREFSASPNPHPGGRYILRFWAVDYQADVWLNGIHFGRHINGETPFEFDVTSAIRPGSSNLLAVRVLNPTTERIDGIVLMETPHGFKNNNLTAEGLPNAGGIIDSVELLAAPAVRVEDLFVRGNAKTGRVRAQANLRNAGPSGAKARVEFSVSMATGETVAATHVSRQLASGDTLVEATFTVANPRLWDLNDPYLYRVKARVEVEGLPSVDEQSAPLGLRDFRFENGYFRLNGRRIYLRSAHTLALTPISSWVPCDPDLLRRDLLNEKAMGFNMVRFIGGVATRDQLNLCDQIGLMVYEESHAGWIAFGWDKLPNMGELFDMAVREMIKRDRHHPSITIWGLMNELSLRPVTEHAVRMLPLIRSLDDTRMVLFNSGRPDGLQVGSLSNPGSHQWEPGLAEAHKYPRTPCTADVIELLRTAGPWPLFLSEYGIGSGANYARLLRQYEQRGAERVEEAQVLRQKMDRFMQSFWIPWNLSGTFASPEDYFTQSLKKMAGQRRVGLNAVRANPNIVGHSLTMLQDSPMVGEGLLTSFRELKPGTMDALFDAWYPLRWCLCVEPWSIYRGMKVHLEAVLANEDALLPGQYPIRLQVVGPNHIRVFDHATTVTIPDPKSNPEPRFALPFFSQDVAIDGPSGKYRFLATFEKGGAAAGGAAEFFVTDPAAMPPVEQEVVLWGQDDQLAQWLIDRGVRSRRFVAGEPRRRELILVSGKPQGLGGAGDFAELARHIAGGSTAVLLTLEPFRKGNDPLGWIPLRKKGHLVSMVSNLYHKDEWAKNHPIFAGLPAGGLLDYTYYRNVVITTPPAYGGLDFAYASPDPPAEAVAGSIETSYFPSPSGGLLVAVYDLGAGRFILNLLRIRDNLGKDPVAERLLRNMLRYAAREVEKPPAPLPVDFDQQLKALGYLP